MLQTLYKFIKRKETSSIVICVIGFNYWSMGLKIPKKAVEKILRATTTINEMQVGFMPGKSIVDAVFNC